MADRLFISHASEDEAVALKIVAYLEAQGMACWIAGRDIPPKSIYAEAITQGIEESSACAVIVSQAANASAAIKRELELASHYAKPFIPIRIDGTEPTAGVDYYLRNTQWVDFKRDGERALDRIVAHMQGVPALSAAAVPARKAWFAPIVVMVALLVIGAGCWFAWTQFSRPTETADLPIDLAGSFLRGSYHWDGLACGEGPTVTQENGSLVFTMPGTPTYRHEVLSAEQNTDSYALLVHTRVVEPSEHGGESYTLGVTANAGTIVVATGDRTYAWDRCEGANAQPPPSRSESQHVFRGNTRVRRSDGRREVWVQGQGYVPEGSMAALSRPNQERTAP